MTKKVYTYFIWFSFHTNDGNATEINSVNDFPFKLDTKENIDKMITRFMTELNKSLMLQGIRVMSLVIKNFIFLSEKEEPDLKVN